MQVLSRNITDKKKKYSAFVLFVPKNNREKFLKSQPQIIKQVLKEKLFKGGKNEVLFLPFHPVHHGKHLILAGLEDPKNPQAYRQAGGLGLQGVKPTSVEVGGCGSILRFFITADHTGCC